MPRKVNTFTDALGNKVKRGDEVIPWVVHKLGKEETNYDEKLIVIDIEMRGRCNVTVSSNKEHAGGEYGYSDRSDTFVLVNTK